MATTALRPDSHSYHTHPHHQYVSRRDRDASPSTYARSTRPSRDSSRTRQPRQPSRPRLLRACATEPSITTANSCSGLLTAPNATKGRATELLSRVAVSNSYTSAANTELRLSPTTSPSSSTHSFQGEGDRDRDHRGSQMSSSSEAMAAQRMLLHRSCTGSQQQQQRLSPSSNSSPVSVSAPPVPVPVQKPQGLLELTLTTSRELGSAGYFSFPSFDEWEQPAQQTQEKAY